MEVHCQIFYTLTCSCMLRVIGKLPVIIEICFKHFGLLLAVCSGLWSILSDGSFTLIGYVKKVLGDMELQDESF